LKKVRKSRGLSQENLANDVGIEISQIGRIERGIINTSVYNTFKIAKTLNIEIKDLFDF
jgi:transcriptional regulator with XRE-family HTH domain